MEIKFKRDTLYQIWLDGDFVVGEQGVAMVTGTRQICGFVSLFCRCKFSKCYNMMNGNILSFSSANSTAVAIPNSNLLCDFLPIPTSISKFTSDVIGTIIATGKLFIPKTITGKTTKAMVVLFGVFTPIKFKGFLLEFFTAIIAFKNNWLFPVMAIPASVMGQTLRVSLARWREALMFIPPFSHTRTATKTTQLVIPSLKGFPTIFTNSIYHTLMVAQCR